MLGIAGLLGGGGTPGIGGPSSAPSAAGNNSVITIVPPDNNSGAILNAIFNAPAVNGGRGNLKGVNDPFAFSGYSTFTGSNVNTEGNTGVSPIVIMGVIGLAAILLLTIGKGK
jgi:hypothetical protein